MDGLFAALTKSRAKKLLFSILDENIEDKKSLKIFWNLLYGFSLTSTDKRENIHEKYSEKEKQSLEDAQNEDEQEELEEQQKGSSMIEQQNLAADKNYLKNLSSQSQEYVQINGKRFKRYNIIVVKLKRIRGYKCQICGIGIKKANGDLYVEGAHIIPKKDGGPETPDNIVLLCPNHHKELDKVKKEIIKLDDSRIILKINDVEFPIINLAIE